MVPDKGVCNARFIGEVVKMLIQFIYFSPNVLIHVVSLLHALISEYHVCICQLGGFDCL